MDYYDFFGARKQVISQQEGNRKLLVIYRRDIIIIDELTAFKNAQADRSKVMKKIAHACKATWGMTGLVCPNSPTEAWSQGRIINPSSPYLPRYYSQFRDQVVTEIMQRVWIPRIGSDQVVHRALQPSIRFTREECLDLPDVLNSYVDIPMTIEQTELYNKMKKELYIKYQDGEISAVNAGVMLGKLLQITAGAVKNDDGSILYCDADNKIESIIETFNNLGRTKLVVVAAFRAVVEKLNQIFAPFKVMLSAVMNVVAELASTILSGVLAIMNFGNAIISVIPGLDKLAEKNKAAIAIEKEKLAIAEENRKEIVNDAKDEAQIAELKAKMVRADLIFQ